jgi:hypothetical protein
VVVFFHHCAYSTEAEPGPAPRLTVSALASDGGRVDHFEVRRGV